MIIIDNMVLDKISKPEIEQVQKEKTEYHILGTYWRTKGLKLFSYNPANCKIELVEIKYSDTVHIIPKNGILVPVDLEAEKTTIDSRCVYFEALNLKSAERRVKRWKDGRLQELFNLRDVSKEPLVELKFW